MVAATPGRHCGIGNEGRARNQSGSASTLRAAASVLRVMSYGPGSLPGGVFGGEEGR